MTRRARVMAVASAGGHWVQLMRLRPAWSGLPVTYVTTDPSLGDVIRGQGGAEQAVAFRTVVEANRWQKRRLVLQALHLALIILRERPRVIITTGAAVGYFAIRLGKILGARTVWIDSMANVEELSLSGRKAGRHADLWLTQWPHLARTEGPAYLGSVI